MPLLIAHRGASHLAPENTLAAIRLAQEMGADGFEFDIQPCGSGEWVLFHDRFPARTTNYGEVFRLGKKPAAKRAITRLSFADLSRLDAGKWKGEKFVGELIPRLEDLFRLVKPEEILDIEVKTYAIRTWALSHSLIQYLDQHGAKSRNIIVSSFNPFFLKTFREQTKKYPIGLISEAKPPANRARRIWVPILKPEYLMLQNSPKISQDIAKAHRQKRKVFVWTVNTLPEIEALYAAGADGVITNCPELRPRGSVTK